MLFFSFYDLAPVLGVLLIAPSLCLSGTVRPPSVLGPLSSRSLAPSKLSLQRRDAANIWDLSSYQDYIAFGDSFSTGQGNGNPLTGDGDAACYRTDGSFPKLLNDVLQTKSFANKACSGSTSQQIRDEQIKPIPDSSVDLITVTAGGNDVGFKDVLQSCVYLTTTQAKCDDALSAAQGKIQAMSETIDDMLGDLAYKMRPNGVIIYVPYAKFWNDDENYCDDETWAFWDPTGVAGGLKLTHDNRNKMNDLTDKVNAAILRVVASRQDSTRAPLIVYAASWDPAVIDAEGRFCETANKDDPNAGQYVQMFLREGGSASASTEANSDDTPALKRSTDSSTTLAIRVRQATSSTSAANTAPSFAALEQSDKSAIVTTGVYQAFHPSPMGAITQSSVAYGTLIRANAKHLNIDPSHPPQSCPSVSDDVPICKGANGPTDTWSSQEAAAGAVSAFCHGDRPAPNLPSGDLDGRYAAQFTYYLNTVQELELKISYYENLAIDVSTCKQKLLTIINGCDVPSPDGKVNPQNLKYGGSLSYQGGQQGGVVFEFNPHSHGAGETQLYCDDVDSQTFMDADTLSNNVQDFCKIVSSPPSGDVFAQGPTQPSQRYNQGTPDEVVLSVKWPGDGFPPTESDCLDAMGPLNGGCSIPHDEINIVNKKHGGHFAQDVERLYAVVPVTNNTITDQQTGRSTQVANKFSLCEDGKGRNGVLVDKPAMQDCLRARDGSSWGDEDCHGFLTTYLTRASGWHSLHDCWRFNANDLSKAVDDGYCSAEYWATAGFVSCTFGFRIS